MKLFDRHETEKTTERLPEMPPGVAVPDDISTMHPPETEAPTTGGIRWMRWVAAILLLGAAGVVAAVVLSGDDDPVDTPTQAVIDPMQAYGSDNATVLPDPLPPRSIEITPAVDDMAVYGTDNPVVVPNAAEANSTFHGEYMRLYGTDNPTIVEIDPMQEFGTDNPHDMP